MKREEDAKQRSMAAAPHRCRCCCYYGKGKEGAEKVRLFNEQNRKATAFFSKLPAAKLAMSGSTPGDYFSSFTDGLTAAFCLSRLTWKAASTAAVFISAVVDALFCIPCRQRAPNDTAALCLTNRCPATVAFAMNGAAIISCV